MAKRHERIITKRKVPDLLHHGGFYEMVTAECVCGWWEGCGGGKPGRQRATYAYRDHIEAEMARAAKPSRFEPEVDRISTEYYRMS